MKNDNVTNILRDLLNDVSAQYQPALVTSSGAAAVSTSPVPSTITLKADNEFQADREFAKLINDLDNRYRLQSQQGKFNGAHNLAESKLPNVIHIGGKTYELTGVKKHILKHIEQEIIGKCNPKN